MKVQYIDDYGLLDGISYFRCEDIIGIDSDMDDGRKVRKLAEIVDGAPILGKRSVIS